jgi:hypothetical protein
MLVPETAASPSKKLQPVRLVRLRTYFQDSGRRIVDVASWTVPTEFQKRSGRSRLQSEGREKTVNWRDG